MEEDVGVKVTVTRLRRRLSVEQSEDGSSPGPATPTKKRAVKLAAKPQLELIDENTPVSSPRKTRRKSLATEAEEKPITPSRRSSRIKSNSSIVSETLSVQATNSPRAKRAARRNSQAGSDNEGPATPARQGRRTRKDSASSVENQESGTLNKPLPVAEMVIEEETENEVQKSINKSKSSPTGTNKDISPNSVRKSKRLSEKKNRRSGSHKTEQDCSSHSIDNKSLNISTENEKAQSEPHIDLHNSSNRSVEAKKSDNYLSESNISLLNKLEETESNRFDSNHNKSASTLDITGNKKIKRNRTESWQEIVASVTIDSITFNDTELSKEGKVISKKLSFSLTDDTTKINESNTSLNEKNTSQSFLDTSSKTKKTKRETNTEDAAKLCEDIQTEVLTPKEIISNNKTARDKSDDTDVTRDMAVLFENPPSSVQATVYFEDSDSNSVGTETVNKNDNLDCEDQCVPEVNVISGAGKNILPDQIKDNDKVSNSDISISNFVSADVNDSCEPMDIDETIHEEILQTSLDTLQQSDTERKSSLSQRSIIGDTDISKRKISISGSVTNTPDRSKNEKRKLSLSNTTVDTPNNSKNDKRKSSISNTPEDTTHTSKDDKGKSLLNTTVDTPEKSKKNKRKSSISNTSGDSPNRSEKNKRTSSVSNSTENTPDLSKNDNNKSTLILSQLKDVSTTSENLKSPKPALSNEVMSKSDLNEYDNKNKKIPKGNLSLNDAKGTPKQNSIKKLSMQTSTPIITQQLSIKTKIEEEKHESAKINKSNFSKSINETYSSEEGGDDDDRSVGKNKLLADEADQASNDYESGDSQNEEERRYEAENEIVERGETLTSDDDVSNDTDYEKDSFIVSSDVEDNELLSGSGDDLSMSDNELSMSKKSKKKFNERKLKEQKNASREMFESRHKINTSDKNSPTPKTKKNRMRIDSSLLTSDEEVVAKPKKNNRMRLDSTIDTSANREETNLPFSKSIKNKSTQDFLDTEEEKKNNKSMHNSICNKSTTDEREITVCNESSIDNTDPLQIQLKQEPKTPQKDLNISVVLVQQDIENVQITEAASILEQTGTDPLQATMGGDDTSDSSENEEILQNYDSVLNELNKDTRIILNNKNTSLNMGNKTKTNRVEPVIDQLNLTQTKKTKKNEDQSQDSITIKLSELKHNSDTEDSSSSIDLQLLFSEDNCGSDEDQMSQQNIDNDNMYIPLKKSFGKTNLRESIEMNTTQLDTTLNNSTKKKKKRKSSLGPAESVDDQETNTSQKDITLNNSSKKKNKRKSSIGPADSVDDQEIITSQHDTTLNNSSKKKNKRKSSLGPAESADKQETNTSQQDITLNNSSKKKNKRKSSIGPAQSVDDQEINTSQHDTTLNNSSKKKNKRKSSLGPAESADEQEMNTTQQDTTLNNSSKKKKNRKSSLGPAESVDDQEMPTSQQDTTLNNSSKKKKNRKTSLGPAEFVDEQVRDEDSDGAPDETPYLSEKASEMDLQSLEHVSEPAEESSAKKKNKKKKKKKSATSNQSGESIDTENNISSNSKKRKRKTSNTENAQDSSKEQLDAQKVLDMGNHNELVSSNKKRKIVHTEDMEGSSEIKQSKKNKKKNRDVNFQDTASAFGIFDNTETQVKKNKKRKHRDEDGDSKKTKIAKDSSFQEVHLPRLPDSILHQLDDKPRKIEEAKVVSTSNFIVENARQKRAKPSNYLEESIYLDDKSPLAKKEKTRIKKPKVLPFIPTASISDSGFTTNFKINKLAQFTAFEAAPVVFSKESYLEKKKIKRLGTYDRYKKQMHHKMSKF